MKNETTEMVFVLDRSASMGGLEDDVISGFNSMLSEHQTVDGEAVVTTWLFDSHCTIIHDRTDIRGAAPLTENDYRIGSGTALYDAIGAAMHKVKECHRHMLEEYRSGKVMFVIVTDGEENSSRHYNLQMIKKRIENYRKNGWEFFFFGANMDAEYQANKIGIPAEFSRNYRSDAVGTRAVYSGISAFSTAYRTGNANNINNVLEKIKNNFNDYFPKK